MRTLSAATRTRLRTALATTEIGLAALPFTEAVVLQCAHPLGAALTDDVAADELRAAEQVVRLIVESGRGEHGFAATDALLVDDPVFLSSCFQNLDLLPMEGGAPVHGIALAVLAAIGRLR